MMIGSRPSIPNQGTEGRGPVGNRIPASLSGGANSALFKFEFNVSWLMWSKNATSNVLAKLHADRIEFWDSPKSLILWIPTQSVNTVNVYLHTYGEI